MTSFSALRSPYIRALVDDFDLPHIWSDEQIDAAILVAVQDLAADEANPVTLTPEDDDAGSYEFEEDVWLPTNQVGGLTEKRNSTRLLLRTAIWLMAGPGTFIFRGGRGAMGHEQSGVDGRLMEMKTRLSKVENTGGCVDGDTDFIAALEQEWRFIEDYAKARVA